MEERQALPKGCVVIEEIMLAVLLALLYVCILLIRKIQVIHQEIVDDVEDRLGILEAIIYRSHEPVSGEIFTNEEST